MRKKVIGRTLGLIMGGMMAFQSMIPAMAADPPGDRKILYQNSFESGEALDDFEDITGDLARYTTDQRSELTEDEGHGMVWKLESGGGSRLGGMAFAKRLPGEYSDVSFLFDMKLPEDAEGQVRIRSSEIGNCGYTIYFRENEVAVTKRSGDTGSDIPVKTEELTQPREETWNTYKITIVDRTIGIQINGEDVLCADDTDTTAEYTYGGITFSGWGYAALIDNLVISEAEAADLPEVEAVPFRMNRESVRISPGDATSVSPVYDEIADKKTGFKYTSDNENVVTVDEYGILTAKEVGEATVTAAATDGAEAQTKVYVNQPCSTFYYVAADGNDETGDGTEARPFGTVEKARDTIRTLDVLPDGGVTVYLRGGEYYIDETIVFTPEDSGEEGKPVVYASYPGETAEIHSGKKITGFTKVTEDYPAGLPEEAKGNLYEADVEPGWRFHDLYVNGERQQTARLYNTNDWSTWETFPEMPESPLYTRDPRGMTVKFQPGHMDNLPSNGDVELYLLPVQWWNSLPVVTDIDAENNTARLQSYNPSIEPNGVGGTLFQNNGKYNLLNAAKFIDEPGEWCVDSEKGKVYWWPKNGEDLEDAVAPNLTELIRLQGDEEEDNWEEQVEYIEFRDLTFKYADRLPENEWNDDRTDPDLVVRNAENPFAAIFMQGVENCALIDSKVLCTGAYAVALDHYARNNRIVRNELENLGCGGVQLYGYGPGSGKTRDMNTGNVILANNIHDLGLAPYQHSSAITIYGASYTDGKFNLIERVPYTSIMITGTDADSMNPNYTSKGGVTGFNGRAYTDTFGNLTQYGIREEELLELGREVTDTFNCSADNGRAAIPYQSSDCNIMEYNISRDYMLDMNDGGCYYAWSMGKNNEYNYNIAEKKENAKHMCWPLYMDDYASYVRLEGNRVWAAQTDTLDKSQGTNVWRDNVSSSDMAVPPEGYEELEQTILGVVEQMGGYITTEGGSGYQPAPEIEGIRVTEDESSTYHTLITMPALPEGAVMFGYRITDGSQTAPNKGDIVHIDKILNADAVNRIIAEDGRKLAVYALDENGYVVAYANITAVVRLEEQQMMLEAFEKEEDGGWRPEYDWQILHGSAMNVIGAEDGHVWWNEDTDLKVNLNAGNTQWKDYSAEMEFCLNAWKDDSPLPQYDNITLAGHAQDERNSWMLIARKSGKLELNKFYANAGSSIIETDYPIETGTWYQMKIVFRGNTIECYIARRGEEYGDAKLTYTDTTGTQLTYGGVEVTSLGADFYCDNVRVIGMVSDMRKNLEQYLEKVEGADLHGYTEESIENLRKAVQKAKNVLGSEASQQQIEDALEALEKAVQGLEEVVEKVDKTLLQKTVEYALSLSTEGATDTAKEYFEKVLAEAQRVLADENADADEVNTAWDSLL
ncbi:family 16 glycoside hydrolase, partial [Lachnoclostridium sp. An169]|uniref:family 16 glycoside hydrolase n=1 Tax=Lachnoclostridium sp. An169 TaxID=1965569 RepID=UPI0013A600E0